MKKLLLIATAVLCLGIGNAFAAFPVISWGSPAFTAIDPLEAGIGNDYNMTALYGVFTGGGDLALKTDVFGTATLAPENTLLTSASYEWHLDLDGNGLSEVDLLLKRDGSAVPHFTIWKAGVTTEWNTDYWLMSGNNTQVIIPSSYLGVVDPSTFGIYAYLEGGSTALDDVLPDSGWAHIVPEPATLSLLGMGILGLFGFRRKV